VEVTGRLRFLETAKSFSGKFVLRIAAAIHNPRTGRLLSSAAIW
jgi:predicted HicB family RNase H-like nuclease